MICKKLNILVAEDDKMSQKLISTLITRVLGIEPDVVDDAEQAEVLLRQKSYDYVFTDYNMPGKNGAELTRKIRTNNLLDKQPKIFGVSADKYDAPYDFTEAGTDHFVEKPLTLSNIQSVLSPYSLAQGE